MFIEIYNNIHKTQKTLFFLDFLNIPKTILFDSRLITGKKPPKHFMILVIIDMASAHLKSNGDLSNV